MAYATELHFPAAGLAAPAMLRALNHMADEFMSVLKPFCASSLIAYSGRTCQPADD